MHDCGIVPGSAGREEAAPFGRERLLEVPDHLPPDIRWDRDRR
jgi:hypothetical protein